MRMVFVRAYASGFVRAQQTAAAILTHHPCELRIDARLNERISGMDGEPTGNFNDLVRPDPLRIKSPRGESFLEQMARLRDFLDAAAASALPPDGMVLAVSHGNPILAARPRQPQPGLQADRAETACRRRTGFGFRRKRQQGRQAGAPALMVAAFHAAAKPGATLRTYGGRHRCRGRCTHGVPPLPKRRQASRNTLIWRR